MSSSEIINREISWLSFNHRVLQEAEDNNVPLLERIRFLGIFSNNLDEFFKVRVATIKRMIDLKLKPLKSTGDTPAKILKRIQDIVLNLQEEFGETYCRILEYLEKEDIYIINEKQVTRKQGAYIRDFFKSNVLPVLSIILLKNLKRFPVLKDKAIYLATKLKLKREDKYEYALIEIPRKAVPRFVVLPQEDHKNYIILLDDVIRYCLDEIFAVFGYNRYEAYTIKLTRDAELDIDNDLSKSFVEKISSGIMGRKQGQPVRFLYDKNLPDDMYDYIYEKMQFDSHDSLIPGGRYHNFKDFMKFPSLGRGDLEHPKIKAIKHSAFLKHEKYLDAVAESDILAHYPYYDFMQYIGLLREAAIDPDVKEIKTTVYRAATHSKVINALVNAAKNGKSVTVNIELQARFDEESNIHWSKKLEDAGAKVLFGINGLKVHSKLALIKRKERRGIKAYACISTGNFHEGTAKVYSDFILFTADSKITREVDRVFELFENTYLNYNFRHLLVSPLNMRRRVTAMINNEIENAKNGKDAYIIFKLNNLVDKDIVNKLYQANNAGVKIHLNVRGPCSLMPGKPGLSENIEAISIVDKFLEHSRLFVFCNDNDEKIYLSSADIMPRNLDHRIEVSAPILDPVIKKELFDFINIQRKDNMKARIINEHQDNHYRHAEDNEEKIRSQVALYDYYKHKEKNGK
jgi:polyphosphate kinase